MNKELVKIDYKILPLKQLKETPGNPQKMTPVEFQGLINSMKKDGWILDAPVVWHRPDGEYQIISGHHRVQAGIEAGILNTGMKVIEGISEEKVLIKVIEANQRRGSLDSVELNNFINEIVNNYNLNIDDIYNEIGIYFDEPDYENTEIKEKEISIDDLGIKHRCPKCNYEW